LRGRPSPLDLAVALDSPEVASVRDVACHHRARIVLGLWERDGDAVFNSAALIGPDGRVDGVYRKTHLAVGGENEGGVLPGTSYPVVATEVGRIGCTICVDSSTLEASRMVGAGGADIIAIPIAGDNRADRSTGIGPSVFDEDRWRAIMRTRAMDNHVVLAVARNNAKGSCVISARGDVLAFNDGDAERVDATVTVRADDRAWNGGSLRDIQWMQRRPHLYGRLTERGPAGPLLRGGERGGID
jgi:predicted amidohydrolase